MSPDDLPDDLPDDPSRPTPPGGIDRYREIFEGVALPVLVIDAESWKILSVNEAAVSEYGYTRDEFVGLPALEVRPPEGRREALKVLSEIPHGFWKTTAVQHRRKDGSVFRADVWSRDTFVGGRAVRICTVNDVTDRMLLQHELQQAQKMEAVGRLAAGIAHDFNNVLTSVIGGIDLLEHGADDPAMADELAEIRSAAESAAALTRKLMAFSRQQALRIETIPLEEVVRAAEPLLDRMMGEGIEVRKDLGAGTWPVRLDPNQMEQVVLDLAMNARDAMPEGGTLTVTTRNVSFDEAATFDGLTLPAGEYAELALEDTGIGMDPVTRSRVFEPFFSTNPMPGGTGLGLSVAFGIIRQSGGFITVDSTLEEGSTFRVLLPRADAPAPVAAPSAEEAPADSRVALVVDAEDAVRSETCRVLEDLGFAVLSAASGDEAVAVAEANAPRLDLLLTDMVLPRMTGHDLALQLASDHPELRVLFVSGYGDDAERHLDMLEADAGFLRKPFSIEALGEAVHQVLDDA